MGAAVLMSKLDIRGADSTENNQMNVAENIIHLGWKVWSDVADLNVLVKKSDESICDSERVYLLAKDRRGATIEIISASDFVAVAE